MRGPHWGMKSGSRYQGPNGRCGIRRRSVAIDDQARLAFESGSECKSGILH